MEKVAILGGGHVGLTLAVDLHKRRHETNLDPHIMVVREGSHPFVARNHGVPITVEDIITGETCTHTFPRENVHTLDGTNSLEALDGCDLFIITVPDVLSVREHILTWLKANISTPDPILVFVRGGQGGLIHLLSRHRSDVVLNKSTLALVEDSFYGTRFIADKIEFKRKKKTNVALAGPSKERALSMLRRAFSGPSVGGDWHIFNQVRPLDLQFDPLGYIIHLGVALDDKNLERTARGDQYLHYSEGVHSGNAADLEELDRERVALATLYGANTRLFTDMLTQQYGVPQKATFLETISDTWRIYRSRSAASIKELRDGRVLKEDIPALLTMEWLMEKAGISLPATRAHAERVASKLQTLDLRIEDFSGYRTGLEALSLKKSDIVDLLKAA